MLKTAVVSAPFMNPVNCPGGYLINAIGAGPASCDSGSVCNVNVVGSCRSRLQVAFDPERGHPYVDQSRLMYRGQSDF